MGSLRDLRRKRVCDKPEESEEYSVLMDRLLKAGKEYATVRVTETPPYHSQCRCSIINFNFLN
jgi:hypothetical protein